MEREQRHRQGRHGTEIYRQAILPSMQLDKLDSEREPVDLLECDGCTVYPAAQRVLRATLIPYPRQKHRKVYPAPAREDSRRANATTDPCEFEGGTSTAAAWCLARARCAPCVCGTIHKGHSIGFNTFKHL